MLPGNIREKLVDTATSVFPVPLTGQNFFNSVQAGIWNRVVPLQASFRDGVIAVVAAAEDEGWLRQLVASLSNQFPTRPEFREVLVDLDRTQSVLEKFRNAAGRISARAWREASAFRLIMLACIATPLLWITVLLVHNGSASIKLEISSSAYANILKGDGRDPKRTEMLVSDSSSYDQISDILAGLNKLLAQWPNIDPKLIAAAKSEITFGKLDALNSLLRSMLVNTQAGGGSGRAKDASRFAFLVGRFAELTANPTGAEEKFRLAVQLDPFSLFANRALAALLVEKGDLDTAQQTLDTFLKDGRGRISDVEAAEALTKRAEVHLWSRHLDAAQQDVDRALTLMGDGSIGSDGKQMPLATLLNLAAGLSRQFGDLNVARERIVRSVGLSGSSEGNERANIAAQMNWCGIEARMGNLAGAGEILDSLEPRIRNLSMRDRFRGYFEIAKADVLLRLHQPKAASTHLDAAEEFFPADAASHDNAVRRGMIVCYRQRAGFDLRNSLVSKDSAACGESTSGNNPGLIDMALDSAYLECKSRLQSSASQNDAKSVLRKLALSIPDGSLTSEKLPIRGAMCGVLAAPLAWVVECI